MAALSRSQKQLELERASLLNKFLYLCCYLAPLPNMNGLTQYHMIVDNVQGPFEPPKYSSLYIPESMTVKDWVARCNVSLVHMEHCGLLRTKRTTKFTFTLFCWNSNICRITKSLLEELSRRLVSSRTQSCTAFTVKFKKNHKNRCLEVQGADPLTHPLGILLRLLTRNMKCSLNTMIKLRCSTPGTRKVGHLLDPILQHFSIHSIYVLNADAFESAFKGTYNQPKLGGVDQALKSTIQHMDHVDKLMTFLRNWAGVVNDPEYDKREARDCMKRLFISKFKHIRVRQYELQTSVDSDDHRMCPLCPYFACSHGIETAQRITMMMPMMMMMETSGWALGAIRISNEFRSTSAIFM